MKKFRITRRELDPQPNLARILHSVHTQTTPSLECQLPFSQKDKHLISNMLKRDQATQTKNIDYSDNEIYQSLDTVDSSHDYDNAPDYYDFLNEARDSEAMAELTEDNDTEPVVIRSSIDKTKAREFLLGLNEVDEYRRYVLPSVLIDDTNFDSKKESYRRYLEILEKEDERLEQEIKRVKLFRINKLRIVDYLQKERVKLLDDIKRLKNLIPVC